MKPTLFLIVAFCMIYSLRATDITPSDPSAPLFVIYGVHFDPQTQAEKPHIHSAHVEKVLLTVYKVADLQGEPGKKELRIVLCDKDAKAFAELTHENPYMFLLAGDNTSGVTMHITAPIEDGGITFSERNYSLPVAAYLRKRFNLKPDSIEYEAVNKSTNVP